MAQIHIDETGSSQKFCDYDQLGEVDIYFYPLEEFDEDQKHTHAEESNQVILCDGSTVLGEVYLTTCRDSSTSCD
jgi:hypothetical protein